MITSIEPHDVSATRSSILLRAQPPAETIEAEARSAIRVVRMLAGSESEEKRRGECLTAHKQDRIKIRFCLVSDT